MEVRLSLKSDKPQIQYICAQTATDKKYIENQELVSLLYADYYIDNQSQNCFVLADDNDVAVGYILCDTDYKSYKQNIKPYIKAAGRISPIEYINHVAETIYLNKLYTKYPCHMHIDILDKYQHMGYGKQLILSLVQHLKEINIHSVRLTVGANNKNAIAFYEHLGFKQVKNVFNCARVLILSF